MEWDDLKHFLAVARLGTLSKAAQVLQTTPATVGRRVARLEDKLGARLFDRRYTGYRLTDIGRALFAKTEAVEEAVHSVHRQTLGRAAQVTGKVRVTTTEDIASLVIGPQLHLFASRCPQIQLELLTTREIVSLARGEADVALRTVRPPRGDLTIRQAGWWNFALYAAKTYAQKHNLRAPISDLSNLSDLDVITWNQENAGFRGGPWLEEHARTARVVLTAGSRRVHHEACRAGMGVAILPCLMADHDRDLIRLLPPERVIAAKLWIVVHREMSRVPRVRAVVEFLAAIAPKRNQVGT